MSTLLCDVNQETRKNRIAIRNQVEMFCEEVKSLKPGRRLLFLLYFHYGHTQAEIAALLKIHPNSVAKRLKVITKILQARLKEKGLIV